MTIVDAHHHLWDTDALHYELFDKVHALRQPHRLSEYERVAAANDVVLSVCVEAASAGADGWSETEWLLAETKQSSLVKRITAWAPIESPDLDTYLRRLSAEASDKVVAIRRSFEFESSDFPQRPDVIAGVRTLAHFGYKFELVLFDRSLKSALKLIQACPQTQFVLDHAGKPRIRDGVDQPWRRDLAAIAKESNVVCKISGLTTEADHQNWRKEQLKPCIDHAIACFGWDRVLFGSDWPVCNLARGFDPWLEAAQWATASASEQQRRKLFSENAMQFYDYSQLEMEGRHAG